MIKNPKFIISGLLITGFFFLLLVYRFFFSQGVVPKGDGSIIYIPDGASYQQVMDSVKSCLKIKNPDLLEWIAIRKNYPDLIKPGRYKIEKKISCNELINILRSGRQTVVKVTFNNIRNLHVLAGKIGKQIEADSAEIIAFLADPDNYRKDGFTKENIISVFIPDTYEFYWNTNADEFYRRMLREYHRFWNEERLSKAAEKNLNPVEVSILASIIDDEVVRYDEKPRIAGVYLNRLRQGIPLQACPTIKFALNDFTITRVLYKHLQTESPYNTYRYKGFPPGPIGCPSIEGINAVLDAEDHDYLYFAARSDFSGYHNFSRTLSEHNRNAAEYQRELNRRKIFN